MFRKGPHLDKISENQITVVLQSILHECISSFDHYSKPLIQQPNFKLISGINQIQYIDWTPCISYSTNFTINPCKLTIVPLFFINLFIQNIILHYTEFHPTTHTSLFALLWRRLPLQNLLLQQHQRRLNHHRKHHRRQVCHNPEPKELKQAPPLLQIKPLFRPPIIPHHPTRMQQIKRIWHSSHWRPHSRIQKITQKARSSKYTSQYNNTHTAHKRILRECQVQRVFEVGPILGVVINRVVQKNWDNYCPKSQEIQHVAFKGLWVDIP